MSFIDWDKYPANEVAPGVRIRTPYGENLMLSRVELMRVLSCRCTAIPMSKGG